MTKQLPIVTLLLTLACQTDTTSISDEIGTSSNDSSTDTNSTEAEADTSDTSESDTGGTTDPLPAQLLLHVTSTTATEIGKATVTIDGQPRFTDSAGFLSIDDLALDATLFTARIDAPGHASASLSVDLSNDLVAYHEVALFPLSEPQPLDADQGGTVALEGVSVTIPPGSVVNQWGEYVGGQIEVTLTHLDPTDDAELATLPAPLEAVTSEDEDVALLSVAMAEVSLWQDGSPLQLAEGATATLTLALPDALEAEVMPGDPIPAWSLDLDLGLWVEEGMGTVELVEGELVWSVEVDHFTWWNLDKPLQWTNFECYYVVVEDSEGKLVNHGFSLTAPHQGGIFTDGGSSSPSTSNVVSNCGVAPIGTMPNFTLVNADAYVVTPNLIMGSGVHSLCRVNGQPNPNCSEIHVTLAPEEPPEICQLGTYMACPYPAEYRAQLGMGACEAGKDYCIDGGTAWTGCTGEWTPQPENCSTPYDDDCDGTVDDPDAVDCGCTVGMVACYGGPEQTYGVGMCDGGWRYCDPQLHEYGECIGDIVPAEEDCVSDADEDCDGLSSCIPPEAPVLQLTLSQVKQLDFSWAPVVGAQYYQLLESVAGEPHALVGGMVLGTATSLTVPLHFRMNASYIVQACNAYGCTGSAVVDVAGSMASAIGYFKASNSGGGDSFGRSIALSVDGNTFAVGAIHEDSNAVGIDGNQADNSAQSAGAVYVFERDGQGEWSQAAYVKASNTNGDDIFGVSVALSGDGSTLAVGAVREDSNAMGIDGNQADNSAMNAGAVYVFERDDQGQWSQSAYVKASNTNAGDYFGARIALSGDGGTLAVGAYGEDSNAVGIDGNQADNSALDAGAVYMFERDDQGEWGQTIYIKASNTNAYDQFGAAVALSGDGSTLAVGAYEEDSNAVGIDGNQADNSAVGAGAVYVFERDGQGQWSHAAYIKASNANADDIFGTIVALNGDGGTLAVGAYYEDSNAVGINGDQSDNSSVEAGAVYVFERDGQSMWSQVAFVKASNTNAYDIFGYDVSLSEDGNTLAVGAHYEDGGVMGLGGNQADNSAVNAGAMYVFVRDAQNVWSQAAYVKASNTNASDDFGYSVALSGDGSTLAVSANSEDSNAMGIGGNQYDNSLPSAGAVYLF